jgi:hypothetical protein
MSSLDPPTAGDSPSRSHPLARDPLMKIASPDIRGELAGGPFPGCPETDDSETVPQKRNKKRKQSEQERPAAPPNPSAQPEGGGFCKKGCSAVDSNIKEGVEEDASGSAARRGGQNCKRKWRRKHAQPAKAVQPLEVCSSGVLVHL